MRNVSLPFCHWFAEPCPGRDISTDRHFSRSLIHGISAGAFRPECSGAPSGHDRPQRCQRQYRWLQGIACRIRRCVRHHGVRGFQRLAWHRHRSGRNCTAVLAGGVDHHEQLAGSGHQWRRFLPHVGQRRCHHLYPGRAVQAGQEWLHRQRLGQAPDGLSGGQERCGDQWYRPGSEAGFDGHCTEADHLGCSACERGRTCHDAGQRLHADRCQDL